MLRILDRYVIREVLAPFGLALSLFATFGQMTSTTRVPASINRRASSRLCPNVFMP